MAYIFVCQKFSASLVNRQNDSSRHIIACLGYFLYSSYSRNRFSPKKSFFYFFQMIFSLPLWELPGSSLFKKLAGRGGHHMVVHCASGMTICLPHEAASRVACRRACILIGLICSTIGRYRLMKKWQKSADQSVDL